MRSFARGVVSSLIPELVLKTTNKFERSPSVSKLPLNKEKNFIEAFRICDFFQVERT
jgi:hypothetical protein